MCLCLSITLLAIASANLARPRRTSAALAPAIRNAIVLVARRNPVDNKRLAIGTAFHIGGGWFRTAAHVASSPLPWRFKGRGYDELALYQADEFGNPGRWLAGFDVKCVDPRWKGKGEDLVFPHDSALLKIANESAAPAEFLQTTSRPLQPGEAISVWGFPHGSVLFVARAKVTEVSTVWIRFLEEVGTPSLGGHSGSPLLEASGSVAGILVGGRTGVGVSGTAVAIGDAEQGCPRP